MRYLLLLTLLIATPAWSAVKTCTAARVTAGDCPGTGGPYTILLFAFPTADLLELADELAEHYGWPIITCTAADAAATPARCVAGQIGQEVTTPETKTQFGNRMIAEELRRRVFSRRKRLAAAAAEAGATNPAAIE